MEQVPSDDVSYRAGLLFRPKALEPVAPPYGLGGRPRGRLAWYSLDFDVRVLDGGFGWRRAIDYWWFL